MTWQHIFINPERRVLRSGWRVTIFFMVLFSLIHVALRDWFPEFRGLRAATARRFTQFSASHGPSQ